MRASPGGWRLGGANTKSRPTWLVGQPQPSQLVGPKSSQPHPTCHGHCQFPKTTSNCATLQGVLKHEPHCPSRPAATVPGRLQHTGRGQTGVCPSQPPTCLLCPSKEHTVPAFVLPFGTTLNTSRGHSQRHGIRWQVHSWAGPALHSSAVPGQPSLH